MRNWRSSISLAAALMLMKHSQSWTRIKYALLRISVPTPKGTNICPIRGCYGASGADRGMFYGEETGNQKYQACVLAVRYGRAGGKKQDYTSIIVKAMIGA